jgi:hypothetical protein
MDDECVVGVEGERKVHGRWPVRATGQSIAKCCPEQNVLPESRPQAHPPYNVLVKTTLIYILLGTLLGVAAASYIVPPALSWYTEPGGLPHGTQIQALVQIPEVIRYATGRLIRGQMIGGAIGAVAGLVLGIMIAPRARRIDRR